MKRKEKRKQIKTNSNAHKLYTISHCVGCSVSIAAFDVTTMYTLKIPNIVRCHKVTFFTISIQSRLTEVQCDYGGNKRIKIQASLENKKKHNEPLYMQRNIFCCFWAPPTRNVCRVIGSIIHWPFSWKPSDDILNLIIGLARLLLLSSSPSIIRLDYLLEKQQL